MAKLLLPLFIMFLCSAELIGQQQNFEEVVYLKNGSIIRGVIIEQIPNVSLKIQTSDRNVFAIKMDEVEKMTKEPIVSAGSLQKELNLVAKKSSFTPDSIKSNGYENLIEVGLLVGVRPWIVYYQGEKDEFDDRGHFAFFSAHYSGLFRMSKIFSVGYTMGIDVGGSLDDYNYYTKTWLNFPLGIDFRIRPLTRRVSPILSQQIGVCLSPYKRTRSIINLSGNVTQTQDAFTDLGIGAFSHTQVGFSVLTKDAKCSLGFSLGYRLVHHSITSPYYQVVKTGSGLEKGGNEVNHNLFNQLSFLFAIKF